MVKTQADIDKIARDIKMLEEFGLPASILWALREWLKKEELKLPAKKNRQ